LQAQGVLNEQPKMLFNNEQTVGAFLNSNGIGGEYRLAKYINARNDRLFEIGLHYVKHPKEYKSVRLYQYSTRRFVFGKENLFWELQGHIGHQHELYRKYDFSAISVRLYYVGGVSLGFLKPVYYEILNSLTGNIEDEIRFDPSVHPYHYGGTASFTKGFNEIKIVRGLSVKGGFSFEYSEREPVVHALDVGLGFTAYPSNIEIMAIEKDQYFFFKMFAAYRFGTLIDISEGAKAKSFLERRKERLDQVKEAQKTMQ